jgi:hypothetical protein
MMSALGQMHDITQLAVLRLTVHRVIFCRAGVMVLDEYGKASWWGLRRGLTAQHVMYFMPLNTP